MARKQQHHNRNNRKANGSQQNKPVKRDLPVEKNGHYVMHIDDLGVNGEGIGKVKGYTLFVEGALPGEEIEVRVVKAKKNFGFGKLIKVIETSKDRIEPVCSIAKRCGGCQIQHLSYKGQLAYKTKKVQDIMERIGGLTDVKVLPTLGMEEPYHYRNKAQFPVRPSLEGDSNMVIGFFAARSHDIIELNTCHIQHTVNDDIVKVVRDFMEEHHIRPYDETKHRGLVRHIVTRTSYHTGEVMVCIVINGTTLPYQEELITGLKDIKGIASICLNVNREKTNVILGQDIQVLWGKEKIIDHIGDLKFEISPLSFFQVNPIQTEVLYKKALDYADLTGEEIVWDAYCGIGSISLFLAQKAKQVYGVEIVAPAIEDAKRNAELNGMTNADFFVGKAEEVIPEKYAQGIKADVMVVDPPRKGCDEKLLNTIVDMAPERVVYVSCDPATLARDLKYLVERGFVVEEIQPVDMFPHTTHVECVVKLVRD